MTIAITGATGQLGRLALAALSSAAALCLAAGPALAQSGQVTRIVDQPSARSRWSRRASASRCVN